ncbi:D-alanyl-D-alanine carboxypeptidase family protein [Streptomyces klenkii]|uniref:D-alanyl-D-alanine carboxypeptidase family protein n=1 Tax=Streptomyces klenkii TaxID=1420899 RepID=UPI0034234072
MLPAVIGAGSWFAYTCAKDQPGPDTAYASEPAPAPGQSQPATTAASLPLPWPKEGQAAIEAEGIGSLGVKGDQKPVPIASITKVMTAYVILKDHPLKGQDEGPTIRIDKTAANESVSSSESTAAVKENQEFTERQLLKLMLIPSANNIARQFARWDAGSQEAFTKKMNKAAAELGMSQTTYTGASGIEVTNKSTAVDQLKLARTIMKNDVFRSIVAMPKATVPGFPAELTNTNVLLKTPGVVGLKTGSTTPAGGCLLWAAEHQAQDTKRLILGVVLHQRAGLPPTEGRRVAADCSRELITAARQALTTQLSEQSSGSKAR